MEKILLIINKVHKKIRNYIAQLNRSAINKNQRKKLRNTDFTLMSSDCVAGLLLHDLNLKFLTPTINLYMSAEDYMLFLENIEHYTQEELHFDANHNEEYPLGKLDTLEIHFMHYGSEEEAKLKWNERCERINFDNLFIIMSDRNGFTHDLFERFEKLPFKNKVLFTNKSYPEFPSTFYIKGFDDLESVGNLYDFKNLYGTKYYDDFDYISWFNNN